VRESLKFEGRDRSYVVHVPPNINEGKALPLVIVLHPATANADTIAVYTGFSTKASKEGFIAVYPNGTGANSTTLYWNVGNCCAYALRNRINDVGFLKTVLSEVQKNYPVDPKRIYLTGMSNGAMMSYLLGAEMSDKIAAIAPVVGAMSGNEPVPGAPVSVIAFNGMEDRVVPYNGTNEIVQDLGGGFKPVRFAVDFWVKHNGTAKEPKKEETAKILKETYNGGKNGTKVIQYSVKGGGHIWFGGLARIGQGDDSGIDATDLIWEFFKANPKN
jgi:polyhydroxybutyrate depolymerase